LVAQLSSNTSGAITSMKRSSRAITRSMPRSKSVRSRLRQRARDLAEAGGGAGGDHQCPRAAAGHMGTHEAAIGVAGHGAAGIDRAAVLRGRQGLARERRLVHEQVDRVQETHIGRD
jgi:hypothetical protein